MAEMNDQFSKCHIYENVKIGVENKTHDFKAML